MTPSSRSVGFTRPAATASARARMEARRLGHQYIGPEHILLGLLLQGDNQAARVLVAHGLDLDATRAGVDRLIAQRLLPGHQPSDSELLAALGVDLDTVHARVGEAFGEEAYWETVQRVQHRPSQPVTHAPIVRTDPSPLLCGRALRVAFDEAVARDQEITPEHLLLGLLTDAEKPVEEGLGVRERRLRSMLGLPSSGPSPVRLLVERHGRTLEGLRAAVVAELDRDR